MGSTWHILAECSNLHLRAVRGRATLKIRLEVSHLAGGRVADFTRWSGGFEVDAQSGSWRRPEGWTSEAAERAGVCANPWYGCFSPTWLDQWGNAGTGGDLARNWEQGRTVPGKLSAAAVDGCRMVWREATRLWSEGQQRAEERQRRNYAAETRAHAELVDEVALCRGLPNLGAQNFLVQEHYAAGVRGLLAECDRLRSKRQRTRSEREVLRWPVAGLEDVEGGGMVAGEGTEAGSGTDGKGSGSEDQGG